MDIQTRLPESWRWDIDYDSKHACWTYTPTELEGQQSLPLTISGSPVIIPVEYQWPPISAVCPPVDPRPLPINPSAEITLDVIKDIFLTFRKCSGFYLLKSGLLQIVVPEDFDIERASSHMPTTYGGLNVCYIPQTMVPTMKHCNLRYPTEFRTLGNLGLGLLNIFGPSRPSNRSTVRSLPLNACIEAKAKLPHRKEGYAGRIGLKVMWRGDSSPYLFMSTHIITEAILAKSHMVWMFGWIRDRFEKLRDDWNDHVEIWASNRKIRCDHPILVEKTFDHKPELYPNGFKHDITLIKPTESATVHAVQSPVSNLGWLSRESWHSLRQRTSTVKILGNTDCSAKTIRNHRPSEVLVVGEGIFLNQTSVPKPTKDHDISTWRDLVSRAVLYRMYPDFKPPNGYSGIALYSEDNRGREDGTEGPGVIRFQSFVQRIGHVQNFKMEGEALEKRLRLGRVAFYGAFQVPEALRTGYNVA
ncbi:hypothetical protein K458DRAFT_468522 [Lentithecium fluviatile CBS 122367]|uniref:Uncharacterized protein n=1 Tax=Lentithecium fluviatile CBS 122367 TaxID=1168545 RepID=A0A6G1IDR5_9PLEO|nr:hypothetical protein K458DRAFT_468522 [Lentithecium fluviatile CBS 122367]